MNSLMSERLRSARLKAGYATAADACRAFGWKEGGYRHHENGTREFDAVGAERYGRAFKVSAAWLLGIDAGPGLTAPDGGRALPQIPIIGQVAAGNWREAVEHSRVSMPAPDLNMPSRAFALRVVGDSMDLEVPEGGTIIVDPEDRALFPGKFYVVLNGEGEATFKRFTPDPARLVPCSTNPAHKEIVIGDGEAFTVVGRVIWKASRM